MLFLVAMDWNVLKTNGNRQQGTRLTLQSILDLDFVNNIAMISSACAHAVTE